MAETKVVKKKRSTGNLRAQPPPLEVFTRLGESNYTIKQICASLKIGNETLYKIFKEHPDTRQALERGWVKRYDYLIEKRNSIIDDPDTPRGDVLKAIDRELEFKHGWTKPVEDKNLTLTISDFNPNDHKALDININIVNPKSDAEIKMIPQLSKEDTLALE
jgi:hypothetical protein